MQRSAKRVLKAPSRLQVIGTYRQLLRTMDKMQQLRADAEELPVTNHRWVATARQQFRANAETSPQTAVQYNMAVEYLSLLESTLNYNRHLRDGGWTLNVPSMDLVANVSKYVGLAMPKLPSPTPLSSVPFSIEDRERTRKA